MDKELDKSAVSVERVMVGKVYAVYMKGVPATASVVLYGVMV